VIFWLYEYDTASSCILRMEVHEGGDVEEREPRIDGTSHPYYERLNALERQSFLVSMLSML